MEILRIENLSFMYPGSDIKALDNINLNIESGEFIVVCGESGCGKTTLLKMLKRELTPHGEKTGKIYFNGADLNEIDERISAADIGYVFQNPDNQIVSDKVWHELAFGLESLGMPEASIRRRVAEMANYFGISDWFRMETDKLSGGQKQMLNLASVMVMSPKLLLLDEPTSQLDPIAASEFIYTLKKMSNELGLTIILIEHRLEEVFSVADKIVVMDKAAIFSFDDPRNTGRLLKGHKMLAGLPSAVRIYQGLDIEDECPVTVNEGRNFLSRNYKNNIRSLDKKEYMHQKTEIINLKDIWFRYEKDSRDILRSLEFTVYQGETYCILGGNGSGKTTLLGVIAGLNKAYRGKIEISGQPIKKYSEAELYRNNISMLPQNPQDVFLKKTVAEDLEETNYSLNADKKTFELKIRKINEKLNIANLLNRHPYDLSGGEQQKCALAKVLLLEPKILLLDEPTKGIDADSKIVLGNILSELKKDGITIIIVTHDVEFAAVNADRCALFFDGGIISDDTPDSFFSENTYYTTAASRISRHMFDKTVLCPDVIDICRLNGKTNE